ncbi:MAG: stage 0 sporulation family protein [Oscillospiraceae bacterium]|nr:stage 0 sporulation family protein [Oscillospiraceae bacterium]
MAKVIGVRFKEVGKIYYFDPDNYDFHQGDRVIVETSRGVECGTVALANKEVDEEKIVHPLKKVLRQATKKDLEHLEENKAREKEAMKICEEKIRNHNLDMKLVDVEYTFDNSKILFYFTSDGRVDFRQLVKDLATVFRTRIELRQIGVRDEAKMLGGLGMCGRPFCCNGFLGEFQPVSIKMAKEQGLSLSPVKISGTCGRLMCCLKYEQEAYSDLLKHTPKVGTNVRTPEGKGTVVETALLTGKVKVKLDSAPEEAIPQTFTLKQIRPVRERIPNKNRHDEKSVRENQKKQENGEKMEK